jgi:hypothetical protein
MKTDVHLCFREVPEVLTLKSLKKITCLLKIYFDLLLWLECPFQTPVTFIAIVTKFRGGNFMS